MVWTKVLTRQVVFWCTQRDSSSDHTSAVRLFGDGLALAETNFGPLCTRKVFRQRNVQELMVQRVGICWEKQPLHFHVDLRAKRERLLFCCPPHLHCVRVWVPPCLWAGSLHWPSPAWVWSAPPGSQSHKEEKSFLLVHWPSVRPTGTTFYQFISNTNKTPSMNLFFSLTLAVK